MQISRLIKLLIWRLKRCTTLQFIISVSCQLDFPPEMNLQTQGQQMNWVKNAIKWGCQHQTLATKRSQSSPINQLKIFSYVRKLLEAENWNEIATYTLLNRIGFQQYESVLDSEYSAWASKKVWYFPYCEGTLLSTFSILHCPLCIFADRSVLFFASAATGQVVQGPWMPFASAGKKMINGSLLP